MPDPRDDTELLDLPAPSRLPWIAVMLTGLVLGAIGGRYALPDIRLADPLHVMMLGAGLFLCFFGLGILLSRQTPAKLRLSRRALTIVAQGGDEVEVPLSALSGVQVMMDSSNQRRVLALKKSDGGYLELAAVSDASRAQQLAQTIKRALDRAPGGEPPGPSPAARLGRTRSVDWEQAGEKLTLSWSGGPSPRMFTALGPCCGMALIAYGFHLYSGGLGTIVATAFPLALALAFVIFQLVNVGVTQRVIIDGRHLTVERVRFGKAIKRQQVQVTAVGTVDYTHRLNVSGEGLTIRTVRGQERHDEALETAQQATEEAEDDLVAGAHVAVAVMKLLGSGIQIPLGRLSLAAKIAVDLTISEDIARRVGKSPGRI